MFFCLVRCIFVIINLYVIEPKQKNVQMLFKNNKKLKKDAKKS